MQLKLTWRVRGKQDMDLLVSEDQKIAETMEILTEKGLLEEETAETVSYVRSMRTKNQVNVLLTYSEAEIYSGDILELEEESQERGNQDAGDI